MAVTNDDNAPDSTVQGAQTGLSNDELRERVVRWDKELDSHWKPWCDEAKLNFDMVAGRQWDKADEQAMRENRRQPTVFNRIGPMIDSVAGTEILNRQQVQYLPRVQSDSTVQQGPAAPAPPSPMGGAPQPQPMPPEAPAPQGAPGQPSGQPGPPPQAQQQPLPAQSAADEILTKGADWIRDQCDASFEESDAFRDALICGVGWTESRMDYEEEPEGKVIIERVDPLEMRADPRSRKPCFVDARYLRRQRSFTKDDFEERWPDAQPVGFEKDNNPVVINDPRHRYEDDDIEHPDEDSVTVREYQWFQRVPVHLVQAEDGGIGTMSAEEHDELGDDAPDSVKIYTRRYWRTFVAGTQILSHDPLPDDEFTLKAITGKRDRNKGYWYGLVRPMVDPQRWANKFFSQALHILNSNAKGGLLAETGAFADQSQAEESWAKADSITWVNTGAIEKIKPKEAPPFPQAIAMLMEWSVSAIRDTTGINQELLGMTDRDQPGVLEQQRKESAYAILAPFFDALRRYRKVQGRLLLKYIQRYLPDSYLVRIVDDQGLAQYVQMAKQADTVKFDVIVDEGPAGPNEKRQVFQLLSQFMPILERAGPAFMAEFVRNAPIPVSMAQKLAQLISTEAAQAQQPKPQQQVDMAMDQAKAARDQAGARLDEAKAQQTEVETTTLQILGPVSGHPTM